MASGWFFFIFDLVFLYEELFLVDVFSGLLFASILASVIFVKQYGHAAYGSAESCCKFNVLSGVAKTFLHEGFGQVNVLFPSYSLTNDKLVFFMNEFTGL